ncbi:MAG TPA: NF038122 family metalloprotease [Blastocatellia bacterium]|jgi:hypothetical protein|nr:NF038122 family metalloprotease [Blastocatellia bacterium]
MSKKNLKKIALSLILLLSSAGLAPAAKSQQQETVPSYIPVADTAAQMMARSDAGNYIIHAAEDGMSCRNATQEESQALTKRDELVPLHIISTTRSDEIGLQETGGLKIILRGTPQLENFPQAKNAFVRAAQTWEALIRNPITIIIDVDFGLTRFGIPYDPRVLGSTFAQDIGGASIYPAVRDLLISGASSSRESQLYNALPVGSVPTDLGRTTALNGPSAVFRAIGIIGPVANPATETNFGPTPSIGFNSNNQFDFDPSDGIDAGKYDFDATVVHEIGHALGFGSEVGSKELNPTSSVEASMEDLLRFRPGITMAAFTTAPRILSSGGTHVFFAGGSELALSTGRGNHTGGDGEQASHWKDDRITGQFIGIMDPTLDAGRRETITDNDLLVLDSIGFQIGALNGGGDTVALTSGVAQQGSIRAPKTNQEDAVIDDRQYTIQVPSGANQLRVELDGNQDVDLYVRAAQRITVNSSGLQADHVSDSPTGHETVTITPSSSPALRAATYYIAVLNFGPGPVSFSLTATVSGGNGGGGNSPVINSVQGELDGDDLILTGVAADPDGDIVQAQSNLLDGSGQVVGRTEPFPVNFGSSTSVNFTLTISGMNSIPAALMASVIFIDRRGNRSAPETADFSRGDSGGPTVSDASYNGKKLNIKGRGFSAQVLIEINGLVAGIYQSSSDRKIKIKGNPGRLNLHAGPNRLRVFNGNSRSNFFVLDF